MSDPLSIAASVAGIVSLSAAVFQQVTKFAKQAKGAENNVKELASQTRNLSGVLQNLALLATSLEDQDSATTFRAHHLYACSQTLFDVEKHLKKAEDDFHSGNKAKTILRSLKWPFSADETKSLIADMATHRSTLELALSAETLDKLLQSLASQDEIKAGLDLLSRKLDHIEEIESRVKMDDQRQKIIDFFLRVNPQPNFQTAMRLRQPLTGLWLTESNQTYLKWRDIPNSSLWLSGIPGAGKTVLCGVVIDEVLQMSNESTAVAFHFCDYKNQESQNLVNILCSIAVQLSQQNEKAFSLLENQFTLLNPVGRLGKEPEVEMLLDLIPRLSSFYDKVFLVVDGVDECGAGMSEVAAELRQLSEVCRPLSLAIFSRDEQEINEELSESFAHIEIAAHTKDLDLYVCAEMGKRRQLKKIRLQSPDLAEEIREKLVNGAQGMFRWVSCQLDYLCELNTNRARRDALSSLPPTLPETYHRILLRILGRGPEITKLVRKSLHWISLDRNLSLNELRQAVSIPESNSPFFSDDDLVDVDCIAKECRSFVRKRQSRVENNTTDYIEFAHFTVEEYLRSVDPDSDVGIFRLDDETALTGLSMTCLRSVLMTKVCFNNTNVGKIEFLKFVTGVFFANPFYYYSCFLTPGGHYLNQRKAPHLLRLRLVHYLGEHFTIPLFLSYSSQTATNRIRAENLTTCLTSSPWSFHQTSHH
ncbi:ankyrin repeat protein [Colletotrichum kahawae]|uniref:Ankyrin repeat protein n=1 Tax=Colletotrichum kahawae TaxID=34407 RepID=A0AAD9YD83_COLKA|nr:ankyrin repeat protein [Colletotrichum kahawae]